MKKIALGLLSVVLLATACKKDDNNNTPITEENLVGSYKVVSIKAKYGSSPEMDITDDFLDPCEKDDIITLKSNKTYVVTDAGVQCDPPTNEEGEWSLQGSTFHFEDIDYTIDKFEGGTLQFSATETYQGQTSKVIFTFKKQ